MKTLIVILIIASLVQTTIFPIDLVLIILICRSYIRGDKANLLLAFAFGLFMAFLNLTPLGLQSLVYLVLVLITESLSRSRLAGNLLLIIPFSFCLLSMNQLTQTLFYHESFRLPHIILEAFFSLPTLYLIKFWEERFIVKRDIKLRV